MLHILVPTDLSPNAQLALGHAKHIAFFFNAHISLLRIIPAENSLPHETATEANLWIDALNAEKATEGLRLSGHVRQGTVVTALTAFCDEHDVQLVVMGTRGATGLQRVLVGSNTVSVMERLRVPLLVIPPRAPVGTPVQIALASDLRLMADDNCLDLLKMLAVAYQAEVRILHFGDNVRLSEGAILEKHREQHILEPEVKVSFRNIGTGDPLDALEYYLDYHPNIGMLAMVKRKHSGLSLLRTDHVKEMAYHTNLPLLVLPEEVSK